MGKITRELTAAEIEKWNRILNETLLAIGRKAADDTTKPIIDRVHLTSGWGFTRETWCPHRERFVSHVVNDAPATIPVRLELADHLVDALIAIGDTAGAEEIREAVKGAKE